MIETKGTHRITVSVGHTNEDLAEMLGELGGNLHDRSFIFDGVYRLIGIIKDDDPPPYIMLEFEDPVDLGKGGTP